MTNEQIYKLAKEFRDAPCIVCGAKSSGYKKIHMNDKEVALLPVCDFCKTKNPADLWASMKFADMVSSSKSSPWPGVGKTRRGCENCDCGKGGHDGDQ
jgi:hypothetical protein